MQHSDTVQIRKAVISDAKPLQAIINDFAKDDLMLSRSVNEIYENLRDYWVAVHDNDTVIGCCALHISWENLAEIKALALKKEFWGQGIAKKLLVACLEDARKLGISRIFALTYQEKFFEKAGFTVIQKEKLPHKIWSECIKCHKFPDCDEIAMLKEL